MRVVMVALMVLVLLAGFAGAEGSGHGLTAQRWLKLQPFEQLLYVVGVADTLAWVGFKCPVPPSYGDLLVRTEVYIRLKHAEAESFRAAEAVVVAGFIERGCRRP